MKHTFKTEELIKLGFFQRLFNKKIKENAFTEVNNLFATKPVLEIKSAEMNEISVKYKINLHQEFGIRLKEIYSKYLHQSMSDKILSDKEVLTLKHLAELLMLNDFEVKKIHNQLTTEMYKESYNEAISDGKIDSSEREFLAKLQKDIMLSDSSEVKISDESTQLFMQKHIDKIVEDGLISPEEWEEFTLLAKNLDVDVNWDRKTMEMVEKLKLFWLIENGTLEVKDVKAKLEEGESCYFFSDSEWLENRKTGNKKNSERDTPHYKIVRGNNYRAGTIDIQKIKSGELRKYDSGQVFLTNKRIIFAGTKKNLAVQLDSILSITPFNEGVEIEKDNGERPIFRFGKDADIFTMTLTRLMNGIEIE